MPQGHEGAFKDMAEDSVNGVVRRWVLICGCYFALLSSAFAFTRTIIGDESQLLLVGRAVYAGQRLYTDVWYNQMPLAPFVYGAVQELWGPSLYLGRFTSVALSLLTFILCVKTGRIIAGEWGARIAGTLFAFNWVLASHFAGAYSPALTGLFLTASTYFLFKGPTLACGLAAILFADLAVCTRALVFPFTAAVNLYVIGARRDSRILVLLAACLPPSLFYLAFIHGQSDHFLFANLYSNKHVVAYPVQDQASLQQTIAVLPGVGRMFIKRLADAALRENDLVKLVQYFPFAVLSVPLVYAWYMGRTGSPEERQGWGILPGSGAFVTVAIGFAGFLVATVLMVSYLLPSGTPNYQTPGYPLFIILCVFAFQAVVSARQGPAGPSLQSLITVTVGIAAIAYGLPNLAYVSGVRNIEGKGLTLPISAIREVGTFIRDRSNPHDEILTDRPWFALEAGRPPHLGFWMTWYSYAPKWSTEMAQRYHVVNPEMVRRSLEILAPKFVIRYVDASNPSDPVTYAAMHSNDPEAVLKVFEAGYERIGVFPGSGKHGAGAVVYARRESGRKTVPASHDLH